MSPYIEKVRTALHTEPSHAAEARIGHIEPNFMVIAGHVFTVCLVNGRPRINKPMPMTLTAIQDIACALFISYDGYIYERKLDLVHSSLTLINDLIGEMQLVSDCHDLHLEPYRIYMTVLRFELLVLDNQSIFNLVYGSALLA
ncbi:hypothetical protein D3C75_660400 [compost metagenome]